MRIVSLTPFKSLRGLADIDPPVKLLQRHTGTNAVFCFHECKLTLQQLCSPCFISIFWWRINSPFLPDSDHSDYLVSQFQDIQDVCNITMMPTLLRISPPGYEVGTPPNYTLPSNSSDKNSTCMGQTLSSSGPSCDQLSQQYGVATGDLQAATGTDDCTFYGTVCVPNNCTLTQISGNTTWYVGLNPSTSTLLMYPVIHSLRRCLQAPSMSRPTCSCLGMPTSKDSAMR